MGDLDGLESVITIGWNAQSGRGDAAGWGDRVRRCAPAWRSTQPVVHWRRQARQGGLGGEALLALVPVEIASAPELASITASPPASSLPARRAGAGVIEIELGGGCRVRPDRDVDGQALQRVLELLRRR